MTDKIEAHKERFKGVFQAMVIISELEPNQGKIECPICKNELHYVRMETNGHVWGKCNTKDCISWIQ